MINHIGTRKILQAMELVFAEARQDRRLMALAVSDEAGGLVLGARMDGCPARVLRHAIRKSYTAAVMQRDTTFFKEQNASLGKTLADWGDTDLTHLAGGLVIGLDGEWFGGVGVGGNETDRDEQIARAALAILVSPGR